MTDTQTIDRPEAGTDVAILGPVTALAVFGTEGGVDAILAKIREQALAVETDISTQSARAAVASLAYKIARSKTALDAMGKELGEDNYRRWKAITAERARIKDELDALAADVRRPLTEWENAEKARVAAHEAALDAICESPEFYYPGNTASDLRSRLEYLDAWQQSPSRDWQEFAKRAADALASEIAKTKVALAAAEKREAEAAEAVRLAKEKAEQARREREAMIAAQARREAEERARLAAEAEARRVEAERVAAEQRAEAEAKAAADKARAEREAIEAKAKADAEAAERSRQEAEQRAAKAKADAEKRRTEAHEFALQSIGGIIADACSPMNDSAMIRGISKIMDTMQEMTRDWEEYRDRAAILITTGRERIAARLAEVEGYEQERARKTAAETEAKQKAAADQAAAAERKRIADAQAKDAAEAAAREANRRHRAQIHGEARDALVKEGLSEQAATAAVTAIARGAVPHLKVTY